MSKPADFQKNWPDLISQFGSLAERQTGVLSSSLNENELHELALGYATINYLDNQDPSCDSLEALIAFGDPISRTIARWILCDKELACDFSKLVDKALGHDRDPFSVLMDLVQSTQGRKAKGVYYTPDSVAEKVVSMAIQQLVSCQIDVTNISILEPSSGAGVFVHRWLDTFEHNSVISRGAQTTLQNWTCVDVSPAAVAVAQYLLVDRMIRSGLRRFDLPLFLAADTIAAEPHTLYRKLAQSDVDTSFVESKLRQSRYELVIGNPPFGSITSRTDKWMQQLLHGQLSDDLYARSYFEADGQPLNERKTWLHDDYVKFMRFAQWQAERNEVGCMAFVLNSGFLSNLSFRGLRFQLLDSFKLLEVIDFSGDKRNHSDPFDENVFHIETGIAAIVGTTSSQKNPNQQRAVTRLVGSRESKLKWCQSGNPVDNLKIDSQTLESTPPAYRMDFLSSSRIRIDYEAGWSLADIFKKHWSAPVTARDHLVIDFTKDRLIRKIESFLDPSKSDDEVRQEFFPKPRSKRYPPGDSRSWKLNEARIRLRNTDWKSQLLLCDYRPFDQRYILWNESIVDWPRIELFEAMALSGNQCLISRRQSPPGKEYSYFWTTDRIPLDGILRNDNRGNEYCFPMLIHDSGEKVSNFTDRFIEHLKKQWSLDEPDSLMVFDSIIAQFHSSEFRSMFQSELSFDFPRFFAPKSLNLCRQLAELGSRIKSIQSKPIFASSTHPIKGELAKRPTFEDGHVVLGPSERAPVSEDAWNLEIGSHQVLKKLCSYRMSANYGEGLFDLLTEAGKRSEELVSVCCQVDKLIGESGGFRKVFDVANK